MRVERKDGTVTISPDDGFHSATIILMHGLGDSCDGWSDTAEELHRQFSYIKFIVPTAPTRPVTMNGGYPMPAWYDIVGLSDRANEFCEGLTEARSYVHDLLEAEAAAGIPYHRMMLAGFSQG